MKETCCVIIKPGNLCIGRAEDFVPADVYDFVYVPGKGVEIYKNGQMASTIQGLEFKKALFGIWLCNKPAQESLKEEMLGK